MTLVADGRRKTFVSVLVNEEEAASKQIRALRVSTMIRQTVSDVSLICPHCEREFTETIEHGENIWPTLAVQCPHCHKSFQAKGDYKVISTRLVKPAPEPE
jgi:hypothetical protein